MDLYFTRPDFVSLTAFVILVGVVLTALMTAVYRADHGRGARLSVILFIYLGLETGLVESGWLQTRPGLVPLFFMTSIFFGVAFGLSRDGALIARTVPLPLLVAFQSFRLPLELILHAWSRQNVIPGTMTWTGQNWDIIAGGLAFVVAPFASRSRRLTWVFEIMGVGLLLNVMRVAVLSSPVPFGWNVEPPLQLIFHVPYFLILPVCIGGALAGHLVLARALLNKKSLGD